MAYELSVEELRQRLGPVDMKQVEMIVATSPAQRIRNMLALSDYIRNTRQMQLRKSHPKLSDLERCRLMYEWLYRNG
jgi:hypothetical protein